MNKLERICACANCELCKNQKPLMDHCLECQVFWVGLSAKKKQNENEIPLSAQTNSGFIICEIEKALKDIKCYKTNLVKCLPLDDEDKLRYPTQREINLCLPNLKQEIAELSPKIVFLLGEKVYSSVGKYFNISFQKINGFEYNYVTFNNVYYVPIQHPSYMYVYKRKYIENYIQGIKRIIRHLMDN